MLGAEWLRLKQLPHGFARFEPNSALRRHREDSLSSRITPDPGGAMSNCERDEIPQLDAVTAHERGGHGVEDLGDDRHDLREVARALYQPETVSLDCTGDTHHIRLAIILINDTTFKFKT